MRKKIVSMILCITMMLSLMPTVALAADITKEGAESEYFDSLTINGQIITDCTEKMYGDGWTVNGSMLYLDKYNGSGIVAQMKDSQNLYIMVQDNSSINAVNYGIQTNHGLTLNAFNPGNTLDIQAGNCGIACSGAGTLTIIQGTYSITGNGGPLGSAITKTSDGGFNLENTASLVIDWNGTNASDIYGISGLLSSSGIGITGKLAISVSNNGDGNAYAFPTTVANDIKTKYTDAVYAPDDQHFYVNTAPDKYLLKVENGTATIVGTDALAGEVEAGTRVMIEADSIPGKKFVRWTNVGGGEFQIDSLYTVRTFLTMPTDNVHLRAEYEDVANPTYTLTTDISATVTAPVTDETPQASVPASGTGYEFTSISWYEKDSVTEISGNFEGGKQYWVGLYVKPTTGYELAPSDELNVTVNGQEATVRRYDGAAAGALLEFTFPATKLTQNVTKIELTIGSPTVDKTAAECMLVPTFTTTPAGAAEFRVEETNWYNRSGSGKFTGTFEDGKEYIYEIVLRCKEGYSFPVSGGEYLGTVVVNGKDAYYAEASNPNGEYARIGVILTPTGHTHKGTLQSGSSVTCTTAGMKDYYTCSCGKAFEDATCSIEIADLDAWKAEGGNGYIAPKGHTFSGNTCTVCGFTKTADSVETVVKTKSLGAGVEALKPEEIGTLADNLNVDFTGKTEEEKKQQLVKAIEETLTTKIVLEVEKLDSSAGDSAEKNTTVYDAELVQITTDEFGVKTEQVVTKEYFETNAILSVTVPYPEGITAATANKYQFVVAHMFTVGEKAGELEYPNDIKATEKGLTFTVTGLSPIAVSYVEKAKKPSGGSSSGGGGTYAGPSTSTTTTVKPALTMEMQIGNKSIKVNDKTYTYDVAPFIAGDRTMVPVRVIMETLGAKVDWNGTDRTVTITLDGKVMTMTIGKEIPGYGSAPIIRDNRTYVPIRYIMENTGAKVDWIAATGEIIITK